MVDINAQETQDISQHDLQQSAQLSEDVRRRQEAADLKAIQEQFDAQQRQTEDLRQQHATEDLRQHSESGWQRQQQQQQTEDLRQHSENGWQKTEDLQQKHEDIVQKTDEGIVFVSNGRLNDDEHQAQVSILFLIYKRNKTNFSHTGYGGDYRKARIMDTIQRQNTRYFRLNLAVTCKTNMKYNEELIYLYLMV